jgi:hypothetical protein
MQGNITSNGTLFNFGSAPSLSTTFNVKATQTTFGVDGQKVGNVIVGNNLDIRSNLTVGTSIPNPNPTNTVVIEGYSIDLNPASYRPGLIEYAGVRIGGGFQDNVFDYYALNHGGITLDAYGNIYADGRITGKGGLGIDSILLSVPQGNNPQDPVFTIVDNSNLANTTTFTIDGYGNIDLYNTPTITGNIIRSGTSTGGDYDGYVASNLNRLTIPKNTTTNLNSLTPKQGTLVYDTTLNFTKYDTGSTLKTFVDTDSIQIITNKDYDGGTASNSSRVTIPKDTTTNLNALTRKQGTIVHNTTLNFPQYDNGSLLKTFVDTDSIQIITNKDYDGGVASNSRRITIPKDTTTNLNALTRKQGTIVCDTTSNILRYDNGSVLRPLGFGYRLVTGATTLLNTDSFVELGGNSYTVTLPTAVGIAGHEFILKSGPSGANITIATTSSQTIDGNSTFYISTNYSKVRLMSNGANWLIVGKYG